MPFVIIFIGLMLLVAAYNGNLGTLTGLIKGDIAGDGKRAGFIYWIVAVLVIGAVGYIKPLRPLSHALLVLVLLVLFLANRGFFAQFQSAIKQIGGGSTTGMASNGLAPSSITG